MRAAALVLARSGLAVLVAPDRDVLGAVVGGELGATQRHRRPGTSARSAAALSCADRAEPARPNARRSERGCRPSPRSTRPCRNGSSASGSARCTRRQHGQQLSPPVPSPRRSGDATSARAKRLLARGDAAALRRRPRTAQAQECGPCTSTPFPSAMPPEPNLVAHADSSLADVDQEARPELEVVDGGPLVGRVDERRSELRIHGAHRKEAVRDRTERVAQEVAVGEPGEQDRHELRHPGRPRPTNDSIASQSGVSTAERVPPSGCSSHSSS